MLAKHFDAAIVLTDERGNILYFCGPTRKYLDHPTGQANLNLLNMIDTEFSARLRLMLRSVAQVNFPPRSRVPFRREDSASLAKVTIMPAGESRASASSPLSSRKCAGHRGRLLALSPLRRARKTIP